MQGRVPLLPLPLSTNPWARLSRRRDATLEQHIKLLEKGEQTPKGPPGKEYQRKPDSGGRDGGRGNPRQAPRNLVCYKCKKVGHPWTKCPTLTADWTPSDKDVEEARALKGRLDGQEEQKLRAHRALLR